MSNAAVTAAQTASRAWQETFNRGDAKGCADFYSPEAVMKVTPFGEFRGREEIQEFWEEIISDGFSDVEYLDPELTAVDDQSVHLKSRWRMNKAHGVITNELWVLQPDGAALLIEDEFEVAT
ncbi:YybH family protein [Roseibium sp.]|uniref:YybH family protein n=1 Tax=Roseibium sp. TaxID=1936156 RepID=UPI003B517B17